jgi:arabinofuranosyltransferase
MKKWGYLLALLIILESLSAVLYLGRAEQLGFPLDDAWIHQTYARNFGLHGLMAFSPNQPSTGSTSPGWTTLLAAGYLLRVPFIHWAYVWGSVFAIGSAFIAARLSQSYFGDFKQAIIVAAICILEWHLAWAALSGMEITFFTFLSLLILLSLYHNLSPFLLGLLIGLTFLVRPEGIIFALIYGVKLLFTSRSTPRQILTTIGAFGITFLIVITPWVIFNLVYNGRPFPSTISAKFMQYSYPWSVWNSLQYLIKVFIYFLDGPLMLLVPFAAIAIYNAFRQRKKDLYYPVAWILILIGIYAVALPAIYHHGRYLMPLIPIIVIIGIQEFFNILEILSKKSLLRPGAWLAFGAMVLVLWINGSVTFGLQIKLLTESHMQAARWLDAHAPRDAIIATHDIGIIGYVTQRQIVDLAGLVTPEIIPIMNDQNKLASFVRERHVTYLVVFSGYYKNMLTQLGAHLVFSPNEAALRNMDLEPFEVFEIPVR